MCMAQAADVFGTGIVAGAFLLAAFAVHPAVASLDPRSQVLLRQELIRRLSRLLPPFMLLPIPSAVTAIILCPTRIHRWLDTAGCALSLATIATTMAVNAPLNRRFARWQPDALPTNWQEYVRRWNAGHWIRLAAAVAAFLCAILAAS